MPRVIRPYGSAWLLVASVRSVAGCLHILYEPAEGLDRCAKEHCTALNENLIPAPCSLARVEARAEALNPKPWGHTVMFAIRRPVVPAWPRRASGSEQQEFDVRVEPRSGPMFRESPSAAPQELALETFCSRLRGDSSDQDGADPSDALSFRCAGCSSVTICGWQRLRGESFRLHTGFLGLLEGLAHYYIIYSIQYIIYNIIYNI